MVKPDDYLKRYRDRYRILRGEDGIWCLKTRRLPRGGTEFEVYVYSDTHLAACLPPKAARSLVGRYSDAFIVHQDADDAMVLLFEESRLDELAEALRLRTRRQVSDNERRRLAEMSGKHSEAGLAKLAERRWHLSESGQSA
jgi:hypothetical protein